MSTFNVIHHVGWALETERLAAVQQALVANTDRALGLCADKREQFRIWQFRLWRLFLNKVLAEGRQALLRFWNLTPRA